MDLIEDEIALVLNIVRDNTVVIKMEVMVNGTHGHEQYLTEAEVLMIVRKFTDEELTVDKYITRHASHKMLGFLSDYWKLKVDVSLKNGRRDVLSFFIKLISKSNAAKAIMVREMNLFQKETFFYNVLKERMDVPGLKPWSARFVTALNEAMVFQDLNALHYRVRNKFDRFDVLHTLHALEAIARFHASSIILEERKTKILGRPYIIHEEYEQFLDRGGYRPDDIWFQQCMKGALEGVKAFSKYSSKKDIIESIESKWSEVWCSSLPLSDFSHKYRNVICHRDLWNNNILFHYESDGDTPDSCVLVDFAAVRCQPPSGDVMLLLYCNLDPKLREENMDMFLNHYYNELKAILTRYNIGIDDVLTKQQFFESAEEQRLWGIILCACLLPQFWIDDDLMTEIFTDTAQFNDILNNDKGTFIKKMMGVNDNYRETVIELFDEIVERYCLTDSQ